MVTAASYANMVLGDMVMKSGDKMVLLEKLPEQASCMNGIEANFADLERKIAHLTEVNQSLEEQLRLSKQEKIELEWVFESAMDLYVVFDVAGSAIKVNGACERLLGYKKAEFLSKPIDVLVHPDDIEHVQSKIAKVAAGVDSVDFESRLLAKDGTWRWFSWNCPGHDMQCGRMYAIARDVTERHFVNEALQRSALYDALTGLANRAHFEHALAGAISRVSRNPQWSIALIIFDLDGFKAVNDGYGHDAGDDVLRAIAKRLAPRQRAGELLCRLGGDEFAWILEGPAPLKIDAVVDQILREIRIPVRTERFEASVSCSVGVAFYTQTAGSSDVLRKRADQAMYVAKRHGKDKVYVFSEDSDGRS